MAATPQQLEDFTNDSRIFGVSSPPPDPRNLRLLRLGCARRTAHVRHLDSSETFPSEHASICDAEYVSSERYDKPNFEDFDKEEGCNSLPRQRSFPLSIRDRWPKTRLDTVDSNINRQVLKTSLDPSHLTLASHKSSKSLHHEGILGIVQTEKGPGAGERRRSRIFNVRSFSLNDLDCLRPAHKWSFHGSSSSSNEVFRLARRCVQYPVQPREPPLVRIPTPPGLPTFGTRAAMEFRMPPPKRRSWVRRWRDDHNSADPAMSSTNPLVATNAFDGNDMGFPSLSEGLKRLLGIPRIVSPIPQPAMCAPLPLYLARADDGTYIRGRFGPRHSAHGGRGLLESHPFHRNDQDSRLENSRIERQIQLIDKACAETERERSISASLRTTTRSPRDGTNANHRLPNQRHPSIADVLSQPTTLQEHPLPNSVTTSDPAPRPLAQAMSSRHSLTHSRVDSGGSVYSRDTMSIEGLRQFVELGERVSVEQNRELLQKKKERGRCANCWFAFCMFCGGEDPDGEIVDAGRVMMPPMALVAEDAPNGIQRMVYR